MMNYRRRGFTTGTARTLIYDLPLPVEKQFGELCRLRFRDWCWGIDFSAAAES